ncbi:MAG: signal peptidase I [Opitutae bacterium]|nr:signal peptidase I [Opitutae bacterium]
MFGLFASPDKKMRTNARNWLELADKVWHYRRDQLNEADTRELRGLTDELRVQVAAKADANKLKLGIERLEPVLRRVGGKVYPKTALIENVEFFLIAAIVIIGIRTYFVQPFKIPTNSMWPSYYGMTPEVFTRPADEPGYLMQALRFVTFGATSRRVDAPDDGEVMIPMFASSRHAQIPYRDVPGRTWLVLPTTLKEYTILVGRQPVTVKVPAEFDFEWAVRDAFFPQAAKSGDSARVDLARLWAAQPEKLTDPSGRVQFLRTGKQVRKGERVLSFDVLTGDQLFVDRVSYHFMRPKVGDGFVFNTRNLVGRPEGPPSEQYYIKRLVGVPGDKLEIRDFTLYRNGRPIEGSVAFGKNARREDNYVGYRKERQMSEGQTMTVPADEFLPLGDNSANSMDGRYWGFVPKKDAIGRPLVIYFPFTRRWGPVR